MSPCSYIKEIQNSFSMIDPIVKSDFNIKIFIKYGTHTVIFIRDFYLRAINTCNHVTPSRSNKSQYRSARPNPSLESVKSVPASQ